MKKFLLTSILIAVLTPSPISAERSLFCQKSLDVSNNRTGSYAICTDASGSLSVFGTGGDSTILKMYGHEIHDIGSDAFKKVLATNLEIVSDGRKTCSPSTIQVTSKSFQGLQSVKNITLGCVQLRGALNPFKNLKSLRTLNFGTNQFTQFPRELCADIENLEELTVEHQKIKSLSSVSFSEINEGLESLTVSAVGLESIEPQSFSRFRHLRTLSLTGNNLEILRRDMFYGLEELEHLNVAKNKLREIEPGTFADLKNLTYLNLEYNHLKSLPDNIFNSLANLKTLLFYGNEIRVVPSDLFDGLDNLRKLSLGLDKEVQIAEHAFDRLNLSVLFLKYNQYRNLKAGLFSVRPTTKIIFDITARLKALAG